MMLCSLLSWSKLITRHLTRHLECRVKCRVENEILFAIIDVVVIDDVSRVKIRTFVAAHAPKKIDLKLHHPADAQLRAPLLAIGAYAALSPGQQGRRAKGPRAQEPRV